MLLFRPRLWVPATSYGGCCVAAIYPRLEDASPEGGKVFTRHLRRIWMLGDVLLNDGSGAIGVVSYGILDKLGPDEYC